MFSGSPPRTLTAQTITFPAPADTLYSAGPVSLSATATSGLPVAFTSSTPAVCTVAGTSATLLRLGTCTISASQPGNGTYAVATPVSQSFNVNGIVGTTAGGGVAGAVWDGGPAAFAFLSGTTGVAVDASGNIYIADSGNNLIRKVSPTGSISTVAGGGTGGDGGPATAARLSNPQYVAIDTSGNLFIAETSGNRVRRVSPAGTISTFAGGVVQGFSGDGGPATSALLNGPSSLALDTTGNLYIADAGNSRVRKVAPNGTISTVAGNGSAVVGADGTLATASAAAPTQIALDASGNLYMTEQVYVRRVSPSGVLTTVAGAATGSTSPSDGSPATSGPILYARGIAVDGFGNLFITDGKGIRKVNPAGTISTVAGAATQGYSGDGGPATSANFQNPTQVAVDSNGNLYIAETGRVREIKPLGEVITFPTLSDRPYGTAPFVVPVTTASGLPATLTSTTLPVCTISGTVVTLLASGVCSLTATRSGSASYAAASPATQTFSVTKVAQTITFTAPSTVTLSSAPVALTAAASSGSAVAFASNSPAICTVSGTSAVLVAVGTCSITATQGGNANYNAANPVTQTFPVTRGYQTITFVAPPAGSPGGTATLAATSSSGLPVTYTSVTPTVCTVAGSIVSFLAAGSCYLTAAQPGDSNYFPASTASAIIPVNTLSVTITALPAWGVAGTIQGTVTGQQSVAVALLKYVFIADYGWVQPGGCGQVSISSSGQFSVNYSSGLERYATRLSFFLVPSSTAASVPCQQGAPDIPDVVRQNALASTSYPRLPGYQTLNFGGLDWYIKTATFPVWPNANNFSASNAFVDSSGALHLQVGSCSQGYCSAEILTQQTLGYGTYSFNVSSPVNALDPNITFGAFTWDAQAYTQSNREWDIELSRWGVPTDPNAQFVVQPYTGATNIQRFTIVSAAASQHSVTWSPTSVSFTSSVEGGSYT
jgi:sugar lactone lactonase YvrE